MFSVGQKVVCIADKWQSWETGRTVPGPKKGDILKILRVLDMDGTEYLIFEGDGSGYVSHKFRPLDYDFVERILKQVQPEPMFV